MVKPDIRREVCTRSGRDYLVGAKASTVGLNLYAPWYTLDSFGHEVPLTPAASITLVEGTPIYLDLTKLFPGKALRGVNFSTLTTGQSTAEALVITFSQDRGDYPSFGGLKRYYVVTAASSVTVPSDATSVTGTGSPLSASLDNLIPISDAIGFISIAAVGTLTLTGLTIRLLGDVEPDYTLDNGLDTFMEEGQQYLADQVPEFFGEELRTVILADGDSRIMVPGLRVLQKVLGEKLDDASYGQFELTRPAFITQITDDTSGVPSQIQLTPDQRMEKSFLGSAERAQIADSDYLTLGWADTMGLRTADAFSISTPAAFSLWVTPDRISLTGSYPPPAVAINALKLTIAQSSGTGIIDVFLYQLGSIIEQKRFDLVNNTALSWDFLSEDFDRIGFSVTPIGVTTTTGELIYQAEFESDGHGGYIGWTVAAQSSSLLDISQPVTFLETGSHTLTIDQEVSTPGVTVSVYLDDVLLHTETNPTPGDLAITFTVASLGVKVLRFVADTSAGGSIVLTSFSLPGAVATNPFTFSLTTLQAFYNYNAVLNLAAAGPLKLTLYGLFRPQRINERFGNKLLRERPDLLILSTLYHIEVSLRNNEGAKAYLDQLNTLLWGIRADIADQSAEVLENSDGLLEQGNFTL